MYPLQTIMGSKPASPKEDNMKTAKNLIVAIALISTLSLFTGCAQITKTNPDGSTTTSYVVDKQTIRDYSIPLSTATGLALGQAIGHNTRGTVTGGAIGVAVGLVAKWISGDNTSQQAKQLPTQSNHQGVPFIIKDGRSASSKRLGMDQSGDWKIIGIPIYDQWNNLLYTKEVTLRFSNGNWGEK